MDAHTLRVRIVGRCSADLDATAALITTTAVQAPARGFVTVWPSGSVRPQASSLNVGVGETRANQVLVGLGAGEIDVFTQTANQHLVIDIAGVFLPAESAAAGRFVAVPPRRLLDTRPNDRVPADSTITIRPPNDVPAGATWSLNVTGVDSGRAGFVTAYAAGGDRPLASSLNFDAAGQTRAAAVTTLAGDGGVTIYTQAAVDLVVDFTGYFTPDDAPVSSDGLFVPLVPTRLLDTRESSPLGDNVPLYPGGAVEFPAAINAAAVALNVTAVDPNAPGWIATYGAQQSKPETSTVNGTRGVIVANSWLGPSTTVGVGLLQGPAQSHAVVDITGYFSGPPAPTGVPRVIDNPRPALDPTRPMPGCFSTTPQFDDSTQLWIANPNQYQRVVGYSPQGVRGPIAVIGDSLTWQSASATALELATAGWGPICVDGTIARTVQFGTPEIPDLVHAVPRLRSTAALWARNDVQWVVAVGTNDTGFSKQSPANAATYVATALRSIGPVAHQVAWVQVHSKRTSPWPEREDIWNRELAAAGLRIIPFSDVFQAGWVGSDKVHLVTAGIIARAKLIASTT